MENILFGPYLAIAQQAMISVWNCTPRDFQNEALPHCNKILYIVTIIFRKKNEINEKA